jgi:hypothetical protein
MQSGSLFKVTGAKRMFDIAEARSKYSDTQIADFLAEQSTDFDLAEARSKYSDTQIADFLSEVHSVPEETTGILTRLGNSASDIGRGLVRVPADALESVARVIDNPDTTTGVLDPFIQWNAKQRQAYIDSQGAEENAGIPGTDYTRRDVRQGMGSAGTSLATMGAGVAGGIAGGLTGNPAGVVAGQMAAAGAMGYKVDKSMVSDQLRDHLSKSAGWPITDDEFADYKTATIEEALKTHGLHEAGWEGVSNAIELSILKNLKGSNLPTKVLTGLAKFAATEWTSEAETQIGQGKEEFKLGLRPDSPDYTSVADQGQAFKEAALPTFMLGGAAVGGKGAVEGVKRLGKPAAVQPVDQTKTAGMATSQEPATPEKILSALEASLYDGQVSPEEVRANIDEFTAQGISPEQVEAVLGSFKSMGEVDPQTISQEITDPAKSLDEAIAASSQILSKQEQELAVFKAKVTGQDTTGERIAAENAYNQYTPEPPAAPVKEEPVSQEWEAQSLEAKRYNQARNKDRRDSLQRRYDELTGKEKLTEAEKHFVTEYKAYLDQGVEKPEISVDVPSEGKFTARTKVMANSVAAQLNESIKGERWKTESYDGEEKWDGVKSTTPDWFKQKTLREYDKKNGTNFEKRVNSLSVKNIVSKIKSGKPLSDNQQEIWNYLQDSNTDTSERNDETDANLKKIEQEGVSIGQPQSIAAGDLTEGDKVVMDNEGSPDLYEVKNTKDGKVVLEDGVTKTVDYFDQLEVMGRKPGKMTTAENKLAVIQERIKAESDPTKKKALKAEASAVIDEIRRLEAKNDDTTQSQAEKLPKPEQITPEIDTKTESAADNAGLESSKKPAREMSQPPTPETDGQSVRANEKPAASVKVPSGAPLEVGAVDEKPASEMTAAELLRAAADKMDGKAEKKTTNAPSDLSNKVDITGDKQGDSFKDYDPTPPAMPARRGRTIEPIRSHLEISDAPSRAEVIRQIERIFGTQDELDAMEKDQGDVHSGILAVADDYMADLERAGTERDHTDTKRILEAIANDEELPAAKRALLSAFVRPAKPGDVQPAAGVRKDKDAPLYAQSSQTYTTTPAEVEAELRKSFLGDKGVTSLLSRDKLAIVPNETGLPDWIGRALKMVAWHGSPHKFDKFSTEKIGTGEGAQAYGYGLYMASSRAVAEHYQKVTTEKYLSVNGVKYKGQLSFKPAADFLKTKGIEKEEALYLFHNDPYYTQKTLLEMLKDKVGAARFKEIQPIIDEHISFEKEKGALYQVELSPTAEDYLLWDRPLSEQSEKVRGRIAPFLEAEKARLKTTPEMLAKRYPTGGAIYKNLSVQKGGDKAASEYLHSLGIRGIKYLDGTSRGKGEGNYNFVIFADEDISITALYSKDGTIVGAFDPQGSKDGKGKIWLVSNKIAEGQAAGVATHEISHALLLSDKKFMAARAKIESDFERLGKIGSKAVKAAMARVPEDTPAEFRGTEGIGYFLEQAENKPLPLYKRIISAIKMALMRLGIPTTRMTEADFVTLFTAGARAWSRQGATATEAVGDTVPALYSQAEIQAAAKAIYSKLAEVSRLKFIGMKAQGVMNFLNKNGVKKEEMVAVGLPEYLAAMKSTDKVSKADLESFVQANTVELEDVVLGGEIKIYSSADVEYMGIENRGVDFHMVKAPDNEYQLPVSRYPTKEDAIARAVEKLNSKETDGTHFSQYTEPGAVEGSYREMFVTAPKIKQDTIQEKYVVRRANGDIFETFDNREDALKALQLFRTHTLDVHKDTTNNWADGHSEYSGVKNPVIRIRFNTVNADGKKILRIEELQGPSADNQKKMPGYLRDNIYQLGVKRILAYAKENGFDGVALATKPNLSPGETQAERYDLSKQIEGIKWDQRRGAKSGVKTISIVPKEGPEILFDILPSGKVSAFGGRGAMQWDGKDISDVVGKDIAQKILGADSGSLNEDGLSIGGTGLIQLYDKTIPAMLEAYGKGKMENVELLVKGDSGDLVTPRNGENLSQAMDRHKGIQATMPTLLLSDKTPASFPLFTKQKQGPLDRYKELTQTLRDDKVDIYKKQAALETHIKKALPSVERFRVIHLIKKIAKPATKEGREKALALAIEKVEEAHEKKQSVISKILDDKAILARRRENIKNIRDYLGLTDNDMKKVSQKDIRLMSNYEFKQFKDGLLNLAINFAEHKQAKLELMDIIYRKQLRDVQNLQKALGFDPISKMSKEQLKEFAEILDQYEIDDKFLTERQLQTVDATDLKGIRTWREAMEKLAEETGHSVEELSKIKVDGWDGFTWDTRLALKNPFYKMMVEEIHKNLLNAQAASFEVEDKFRKLYTAAWKSRPRKLIDKLVPTDKRVFDFIESGMATSEDMTPAEIDLAHFMNYYHGEALIFLKATKVLEEGRENYIRHMRRSFLETWKDDGIMTAFKDMFKNQEQDQSVFEILDDDTGNILPLTKFFAPSMHRTGALTPSKNIGKAFMSYVTTFEKMKALNATFPKMMIYAQSLTPETYTPKGLETDRSLLKFTKQWLNNKKGRHLSFDGRIKQGGRLDTSIMGMRTFTTLLDLGLNIPVGIASFVGEQTTNFAMMGTSAWAKGAARMNTGRGKLFLQRYKNFTGRSMWEEFTDPGKEITDKLADGIFGLFHTASVVANKQYLLGMITDEEYSSGKVSPDRLAQLKINMGRMRMVPGTSSLVGSTSLGGTAVQYKKWAVPILGQTWADAKALGKDLVARKKGAMSTKEAREFYRIIGLTSTVIVALSMVGGDDDDSFLGQVSSKAQRESLTLLQALGPKLWTSTPRTMTFIKDFGQNIEAIIRAEEYKTKEGYKGVEGLKRQFTPHIAKAISKALAE